MNKAVDNLQRAMQKAIAERPAIGGFPYLAETLRAAGVTMNEWVLPSCQSLYFTSGGSVVMQTQPLITEVTEVPTFDQQAVIHALREDQAGKTTFPQFLSAIWQAGVIRYVVDFIARQVTYYGCHGECYIEVYPEVRVS